MISRVTKKTMEFTCLSSKVKISTLVNLPANVSGFWNTNGKSEQPLQRSTVLSMTIPHACRLLSLRLWLRRGWKRFITWYVELYSENMSIDI